MACRGLTQLVSYGITACPGRFSSNCGEKDLDSKSGHDHATQDVLRPVEEV